MSPGGPSRVPITVFQGHPQGGGSRGAGTGPTPSLYFSNPLFFSSFQRGDGWSDAIAHFCTQPSCWTFFFSCLLLCSSSFLYLLFCTAFYAYVPVVVSFAFSFLFSLFFFSHLLLHIYSHFLSPHFIFITLLSFSFSSLSFSFHHSHLI